MTRRSNTTIAATVTAFALAIAACGGDDDADAVPPAATAEASADDTVDDTSDDTVEESGEEPADEPSGDESGDGTADDTGGVVGPPDATIAPELPEEYLGSVGPVEVVGDALPPLLGEPDEAIGLAAPVVTGVDYNFTPVRIDAATNGPTMVVFLAHWCSHCNAELPRLIEMTEAGRFPDGLDIVAVSTAVDPSLPNFPPADWLIDAGWPHPVILDGVDFERQTFIAADAFGLAGYPFVVLLDGDGNVASRWSGESSPDEIIAEIETNLGL